MSIFFDKIDAWYLVSVTGGRVLEHFPDRCKITIAGNKQTQLWRIHRAADDNGHNKFSFENVDTGSWLRAKSQGGMDLILTGDRQWWRLEKAPSPGGVYIKCLEWEDTYLCNNVGSFHDGSPAEVFSRDRGWLPATEWYIKAPEESATLEVYDYGRALAEREAVDRPKA